MCGLAAVVRPGTGRIVMPAGSVWALRMTAGLGQAVRHDLHSRRYAVGPIVSHPRSGTWTFLVRPDLPESDRLFAQLYGVGVAVHRYGGEIALPSPGDRPFTMRQWVEPLRDRFRPSAAMVVAAVSRCLPVGKIDLRLLDDEPTAR
ncbi:DNA-directed RNA polymerase subunit beta [Nocardia cyriacigeorgica]|uniref:DNA-directed RNA polymerase subunit beta n=1 Tax=Nocardia cyriacigeorgica TaxID=135487 RepID=UPI002458D26C|nr:DNA-directed RNA polymerase subunit beta [Nocardia cyriacigeorgica]